MKVLLDTHILLWALSNDRRLPERAKRLIEDAENDIFYSIASLWEIEIKHLAHPDAMSVSSKEILKRDEGVPHIRIRLIGCLSVRHWQKI